jgi:hypothetical protein
MQTKGWEDSNADSQKFHPTAAPSAGSTKCVAWRTKPPVLGMKVVISPVVYVTPRVIKPMKVYASRAPAGPAIERTLPDPRKSPVPCVALDL